MREIYVSVDRHLHSSSECAEENWLQVSVFTADRIFHLLFKVPQKQQTTFLFLFCRICLRTCCCDEYKTLFSGKTGVCHESIRTTTILSYAYFFPIPHFFWATLAPRLDQNRLGSRRKKKKILRSNDPRRKEERPHLNLLPSSSSSF